MSASPSRSNTPLPNIRNSNDDHPPIYLAVLKCIKNEKNQLRLARKTRYIENQNKSLRQKPTFIEVKKSVDFSRY